MWWLYGNHVLPIKPFTDVLVGVALVAKTATRTRTAKISKEKMGLD